jgi:hypothetical protein
MTFKLMLNIINNDLDPLTDYMEHLQIGVDRYNALGL